MKYCVYDAQLLVSLKPESSWEEKSYCPNCQTRFHLILGDKMSGSNDEIRILENKFNDESEK